MNIHLPVPDSLGFAGFDTQCACDTSLFNRGAKNSPEHDPNPGGRWQVCPVDDQRHTRRGQKETKCTSKRRIEAGIKPSARASRELRSLGQLICKKSQNMILARLEPYQLLISMRERPFLEMAVSTFFLTVTDNST